MTETGALPDLYPGFSTLDIDTGEATIHVRMGGSGPPCLLLHWFPQSHVMWHRIAPELAKYFTLVIPDLRGYGESSCPPADPEFFTYSKRVMANDNVTVLSALGFEEFRVVGHDRGARVAYSMALDHWLFLAQPYPLPETLTHF